MSSRSYLSIGDVLTLLRQEFPDVTISKIRFLESQGLVNPERTPSGYRKFYDHDVERLRWVLRQQREHFLPLKVIKDRLDDEPVTAEATGPGPADPADPDPAAPVVVPGRRNSATHRGNHADEPVLVGTRVSSDAGVAKADPVTRGEGPATTTVGGPRLPGIESSLNTAPTPAGSKPVVGPSASAPNGPATAAAPSHSPRVHATERPSASASTPASASDPAAGSAPPAPKPPAKSDPRSPAPSSARPRRATAAQGHNEPAAPGKETDAASTAAPEPPGTAPTGGDGASMSVDELAASSGLEISVVLELQEYGLLTPMVVAGLDYFDEDALAVAMVAARFAQFGIEPRHLRLYKNAADREAGFVEQIVLPLVRQRNPEARARAHETSDELSLLGQELRGALLRNALRDLLNG